MANTRKRSYVAPLRSLRCGPPPNQASLSSQEVFKYLFSAGDWSVPSLAQAFVDETLIGQDFIRHLEAMKLEWNNAPSEDVIKSWVNRGVVPKNERREALFHVIENKGAEFANQWITALLRSWARGSQLDCEGQKHKEKTNQSTGKVLGNHKILTEEKPDPIKTSKFLSYVLRHKPESIGLTLDPEGWADISELITKADIPLSLDIIHNLIASSEKRRFSISEDGVSIRANQGHSIQVNLGLEPMEPPEFLYHGTATRFLASIQSQGIFPQNRQYVHLSVEYDTAVMVGQRHGKPMVLAILAEVMYQKGYQFYRSGDDVWLTERVPCKFIQLFSDNTHKG